MKTNLDLIRAACVSANPEIMELKFGCELYVPNHSTEPKHGGSKCIFVAKHGISIEVLWDNGKPGAFHEITKYQILGRPIRLADILLAIGKTVPILPLLVSTTGRFYNIQEDSSATNPLAHWNLRADSLEQQSRETITFLAELLK